MALVAERLAKLGQRAVFVGGAVLSLLIDDPASTPVRATDDVDVIIDVANRHGYHALEERLRQLGFRPDTSEGAPLCRWIVEDIIVDVMPTSAAILGFTNTWYKDAIAHAVERIIDGTPVHIVTGPYFIAMKLEAFDNRGEGDFLVSHDLEDFVSVVDARTALIDELQSAPDDVRTFVVKRVSSLLAEQAFLDALPGHLPGDAASQARVPIVLERLRRLAGA